MAFKMVGFSAFTKVDTPEKQSEIISYIKNNMNSMSNEKLMAEVNKMSDGTKEYNWDNETGKVEVHTK